MLQAILADVATGETIADLTEFSTITLSPRLDKQRSVTVTLPGDTALVRGNWDDGYPILQEGRRCLKTYRNDVLRGNELLWNVAPSGDENRTSIVLTGHDPTVLFNSRFVRDSDGSIVKFDFASPITGAELFQQALDNSIAEVGDLPIDTSGGTFATTVDMTAQLTVAPLRISELYVLLVNTGVVDILMDAVHDTPGILGQLSVVDHFGSDLSETVHFDYATGLYNMAKARREFDMSLLCNRLYYYLGPRIDEQHWRGNITATEAGLDDYEALQLASRDKYLWTFEDIRFFDDNGNENDARPMFHELWKAEVTLRVESHQLLYATPVASADTADQPFQPFDDYNVGDVVASNLADIVGPEAAGLQQRIWGFDLVQEANGPERVSELLVAREAV